MDLFIEIFNFIFCALSFCVFAGFILTPKKSTLLSASVILIVYFTIGTLVYYANIPPNQSFFIIIPAICLLYIALYKDRLFKRIFIFLLALICEVTSEFCASTILTYVFHMPLSTYTVGGENRSILLTIFFLAETTIATVVILLLRKNPVHLSSMEWFKYSLIPLSQLVILYAYTYNVVTKSSELSLANAWIALMISIASNIFLFSLFKDLTKKATLETENKFMQNQLELQFEHYAALGEQITKTKKYRHDIANHLQIVQILLKKDNLDEAKSYMTDLYDSYKAVKQSVFCENPVADAVLFSKSQIAIENNIAFDVHFVIPPELKLPSIDLVGILSNLLDNALDACRCISDDKIKRYIIVTSHIKANRFIITVENSKAADNTAAAKSLKDTFKDKSFGHGVGRSIVTDLCKKNGGAFTVKDLGDSFCAMVSVEM